ncbi:hypothetical protein, partial [Streptomyces sp. NPDC002676]
ADEPRPSLPPRKGVHAHPPELNDHVRKADGIYLSAALYYQAVTIRPDQPQQAAQAMANRVKLYERLAQIDPAKYQGVLVQAMAQAAEFGSRAGCPGVP